MHFAQLTERALASAGQAADQLGTSILIGGSLFDIFALRRSLRRIGGRKDRGAVLNTSRASYAPIEAGALVSIATGWALTRLTTARPDRLEGADRGLAIAKDVMVVTIAATGFAATRAQSGFAATAEDGRIPLKVDAQPTKRAGEAARRGKRRADGLRSAALASAVSAIVIDSLRQGQD